MKVSSTYESIAASLAVVGAIALVTVYYPILNPVQFSLDFGQDNASLSRYFIGTPVSLLILTIAWHFNSNARKLKKEEKNAK
jgi:lysylphosphatidylglycerol synthetase-like protein (DUF2156 family)